MTPPDSTLPDDLTDAEADAALLGGAGQRVSEDKGAELLLSAEPVDLDGFTARHLRLNDFLILMRTKNVLASGNVRDDDPAASVYAAMEILFLVTLESARHAWGIFVSGEAKWRQRVEWFGCNIDGCDPAKAVNVALRSLRTATETRVEAHAPEIPGSGAGAKVEKND